MPVFKEVRIGVGESERRRVRTKRIRPDLSALTGVPVVELLLGYHIRSRRCLREVWYNRARNIAGCTSFPKITQIRGHNSQKHGTEPGKYRGLSTGIGEVIFSLIWLAKVTAGWNSGRFRSWPVAGSEVSDHFPWLPYPPFLSAISTREATTDPVPIQLIRQSKERKLINLKMRRSTQHSSDLHRKWEEVV
jgi:ribosomal protein L37E